MNIPSGLSPTGAVKVITTSSVISFSLRLFHDCDDDNTFEQFDG